MEGTLAGNGVSGLEKQVQLSLKREWGFLALDRVESTAEERTKLGAILARLSLDGLSDLVAEASVGAPGRVYVVDQQGMLLAQSLFCLEPTGHYSQLLLEVLVELDAPTWLAHPMHIKQSLGDQRGKSDQVDALRRE